MKAFHENRTYPSTLAFQTFVSRNIDFLAHWHHDLEVVYVFEGSIRMGINSETRILHAGDLAVCSSGDIHYYDSKDSSSTIMIAIFNPALIGAPGGWPLHRRLTSPFLHRGLVPLQRPEVVAEPIDEDEGKPVAGIGVATEADGAADVEADIEAHIALQPPYTDPADHLAAIMMELLREYRTKSACYEQVMTGLLHQLSGLILRHMPGEAVDPRRDKRRITNMKIMQEVLEYLDANYMHPITLADAAREANMSLFHFSRFFKSISGMSYVAYLNRIRVNQAEHLLRSTDKSILDIALECGFSNIRTFNRVFKQLKERTPSELR
jgi:AraC-like DNA-binding protein